MLSLLIAVGVAAASPSPDAPLSEARHAIAAGRIDQARAMIGEAVAKGASGDAVDEILAELAFVSRSDHEALARYEALLGRTPANAAFAERAGIAALRTRDIAKAVLLLDRAVTAPNATWQAWNARGIAADLQGDWPTADRAYTRAEALNPKSAQVANNRGWSLLLQGRWQEAVQPLERASAGDPGSTRIANNLELARAAVAENLPRRRARESADSWAARLNDAGVIAHAQGDRRRAIAAFSQAIAARDQWFERAANNLAYVEARR